MKDKITIYTDDDLEVALPTKFEVCPQCEGKGMSCAYLGAFTAEDMIEEGPEFMEEYMAGHYDRTCDECGGKRVVPALDRARCTPEQIKAYDKQQDELAESYAIEAAERAMGA